MNRFSSQPPPKDTHEETSSFLMNNEEVFGKRIGLSFKECIKKGYVTAPIIHMAYPKDMNFNLDYDSIENLSKFITDCFDVHKKMVYKNSYDPFQIQSKLLVKCSSVDQMWDLHEKLKGMNGVTVCAGASRNPRSSINHFIGNTPVRDRNDYLDRLKNMDSEAIVMHYDTMSEGINISSFTGVMFLADKLPTLLKWKHS